MFLRFARNTEPMLDNEKYILKRISLNDENAFRELFRYYYPRAEVSHFFPGGCKGYRSEHLHKSLDYAGYPS